MRDADRRLVALIGVSWPTSRLSAARRKELGFGMRAAAVALQP